MAIRILVSNLQSRIRFGRDGPGIYRVVVADYDPAFAQTLARWITELFVDTSSQESLERIRAAHEFGKEQLLIYQEQLRRAEAALERHQLSAIERGLRSGTIREGMLVPAEALYRRITDETALARLRLDAYAETLSPFGPAIDPDPVLRDPEVVELGRSLTDALRGELRRRLSAEAIETGEWPPLGALGALRRGLLQQVELVSARHCPEASAEALDVLTGYIFSKLDLDAQRDAAALLGDAIAEYRRQAQSRPGGEIERARLEEEVETSRRLLQSFQAQLVASDVSRAVEMTKLGVRIEVLDPAPLPLKPSRPNKTRILLAALLLGPLLGAGVAFLSEVLDPVLRSMEDFARVVPEPILGTTPLLTSLAVHRRWPRRHWVPLALAGLLLITLGFFAVRGRVLQRWAVVGVPVQVIDPGGVRDANP